MSDSPLVMLAAGRGTEALKAVPLSSFTLSEMTGRPTESLSVEALFAQVPVVYRCVTLRAQALSSVPFEIVRATGKPAALTGEMAAFEQKLPDLLYRMEASLCLYGAAYLMPLRNRVKLLDVRYLAAPTVTPQYDRAMGLAGFQREVGAAKPETYKVEEIVHVFLPDPTVEVGPGTAPIEAARKAAAGLLNADTYTAGFFEHGGMNITLLITDPATSPDDLKRLETWWRRLTRGVKQAWQAIALRKNVEVKQLGYPLDQLAMDKLKAVGLRDVANAFGVPEYYLSSEVANFATAKSYDLTFMERVIVAELGIIGGALNAQLLLPMGYELVFHPERLEVFQASELQKAQAVSEVVGKPVLLVDEGRELLGFEPLPEERVPPRLEGMLVADVESGVVTKNERRVRLGLEEVPEDVSEQGRRQLLGQLAVVQAAKDAGLGPREGIALALGESLETLRGARGEGTGDRGQPEPAMPIPVAADRDGPAAGDAADAPVDPGATSQADVMKALLAELAAARVAVVEAQKSVERRA